VEWVCILAVSGAAWGLVRLNGEQAPEAVASYGQRSALPPTAAPQTAGGIGDQAQRAEVAPPPFASSGRMKETTGCYAAAGSPSGRFIEEVRVGNGAVPAAARPAGGQLDAELGPVGRDGQGA